MKSKASTSFLKKRSKKLSLLWGMGVGGDNAHGPASKSLFASFSSEKEVLLFKALA
jgi:hypothetical protein